MSEDGGGGSWNFAWLSAALRATETSVRGQWIRYGAVSGLSFGANLGLLWILHELAGLSPTLAFAAAIVTVSLFNFLLARHYIFQAAEAAPAGQLLRYALTSGGFRGLEFVAFALIAGLSRTHYLLAATLVLAGSFLLKFLVYRKRVFVARSGNQAAGRDRVE